ncbi:MAG: transcription antitermination factor NusB [Clostridiaceae bacterium]
MVNRKKSREFLMKLLYMDSINDVDLKNEESVKEFYDLEEEFDLDEKYIAKMIDIIEEKKEFLDKTIEKYLSGWNLDRLSKMNLAILRLSTAELL